MEGDRGRGIVQVPIMDGWIINSWLAWFCRSSCRLFNIGNCLSRNLVLDTSQCFEFESKFGS